MKTLNRIVFSAALMFCTAAPLAASATTLPAGTMITAKMNQTIDSGSAHVGDQFTMTVVPPYPNNNSAFTGAQLYGEISKVVRAGQGTNPVLQFDIDRIKLANRRSAAVELMVQAQETQKHNNVSNIGLTTLAGMIVGNMIGKTVFKSKLGGAAGAVAGAVYASNKRTNVSLRKGSTVVLEVEHAVSI